MRLLWVNDVPLPNSSQDSFAGYVRSRLAMADQLVRHGHSVHFVGTSNRFKHWPSTPTRRYCISAFPVWRIPKFGVMLYSLTMGFYLLWYVYRHKPDIVIVDLAATHSALPIAVLSKLRLVSSRVILDIRSFPVSADQTKWEHTWGDHRLGWRVSIAERFFSGITVITPFMRQLLAKQLHMSEKQIGVWSSGVDLEEFHPSDSSELRRKVGVDGRFVVMYHGSLSLERGIQETFAAILCLARTLPNMVFVVLGSETASGLKSVTTLLKAMEQSAGLFGHLLFMPAVPMHMVASFLGVADVGTLAWPALMHHRTGSPLKLMEYLAIEKPVAVTDLEATREVLGDSPCAFYARSNDPGDLVDAIRRAYERRSELPQLGRLGRLVVAERFTWDSQAAMLITYLESVVRVRNKED